MTSKKNGFWLAAAIGVLSGGLGGSSGLITVSSGTVSVLSEAEVAGGESPAFRDRLAVSSNWGANLRGGRFVAFCLREADGSTICGPLPSPLRLLLVVTSIGSGLNRLSAALGGSCPFRSRLFFTVVSIGSGANLLVDVRVVSSGSGANLRRPLVVSSPGSGTTSRGGLGASVGSLGECLEDLAVVSIGSGLNRRGGVDEDMVVVKSGRSSKDSL